MDHLKGVVEVRKFYLRARNDTVLQREIKQAAEQAARTAVEEYKKTQNAQNAQNAQKARSEAEPDAAPADVKSPPAPSKPQTIHTSASEAEIAAFVEQLVRAEIERKSIPDLGRVMVKVHKRLAVVGDEGNDVLSDAEDASGDDKQELERVSVDIRTTNDLDSDATRQAMEGLCDILDEAPNGRFKSGAKSFWSFRFPELGT